MDSKPYVVSFIGMIYILNQTENKLSTVNGRKKKARVISIHTCLSN